MPQQTRVRPLSGCGLIASARPTVVEGHVQLVERQSTLGSLRVVGVQLAIAVQPNNVHCRVVAFDTLLRKDRPNVKASIEVIA